MHLNMTISLEAFVKAKCTSLETYMEGIYYGVYVIMQVCVLGDLRKFTHYLLRLSPCIGIAFKDHCSKTNKSRDCAQV